MKRVELLGILLFLLISCHSNSIEIKNYESEFLRDNEQNCIRLKLKIRDSKNIKDTILEFRNSYNKDSTLFITCDTNTIGYDLEKELIGCKYLPYHHVTGYISFIICLSTAQEYKELGFFNIKLQTSIAWEIRRFKVERGKITGINYLPGIVDKYTPLSECDSIAKGVMP